MFPEFPVQEESLFLFFVYSVSLSVRWRCKRKACDDCQDAGSSSYDETQLVVYKELL